MVIAIACATLLLTQCKKEIIGQIDENLTDETIEVSLRVDNNNGSKTEISPSGTVTWNTGDKIYVVGATSGFIGELVAKNSGQSAYFTGTIAKVATQVFHFYYVGDNTFPTNGSNFTYNISSQNGKLNTDNGSIAKKHQIMHCFKEVESGTTNLGTIAMTSMMSIVKLQFSRTNGSLGSTVSCYGGFASATLNIKSGNLESKVINEITLSDVTSDNTYYMALIPGTQTLTFSQEHDNGEVSQVIDDYMAITKLEEHNVLENKIYALSNGDAVPVVLGSLAGALPKKFAVGSGKYVYFSNGNLQWSAMNGGNSSTTHDVRQVNQNSPYGNEGTWRFAEHQYDYVGDNTNGNVYIDNGGTKCCNVSIASDYRGWIDLFGWATSGWNNGNTYYMPYSKGDNNNTGYGYGPGQNLTGIKANADWGIFNAISNGGDTPYSGWRTLTTDEWNYLKNNASKGYGTVNDVRGYIFLPNNWVLPSGLSFTNNASSYATNKYTVSQWSQMEANGAVFLPAGGYRAGGIYDLHRGLYWSTTSGTNSFEFGSSLQTTHYQVFLGFNVRLVHDVKN